MNNFNNYKNETFNNLSGLVIGVNAENCTFNDCENTTFERCNFTKCTFTQSTTFYKSNIKMCIGVENSVFNKSNKVDEEDQREPVDLEE